jgi:hypothetical protein
VVGLRLLGAATAQPCLAKRAVSFDLGVAAFADWSLHIGAPFDRVNVAPAEERYDEATSLCGRFGYRPGFLVNGLTAGLPVPCAVL